MRTQTVPGTSKKNKYFAELDNLGADTTVSGDPINDWLSAPALSNVTDPIAWWIAMDAAGHPLSRMALDFLSAPGMLPNFLPLAL
jgi:hypothetical protein